jgi:hypothetical protein
MTEHRDSGKRLARPENRRVTALTIVAIALLVLVFGSLAVRGPLQRRFDTESSTAIAVTEPDWILVAAFEGPANDPELPVAARQVVIAVLDESGIVRPVPDAEVRVALEWAGRPDTARLDVGLAREIGEQHGAWSVIDGQLRAVGNGYSFVLRAIDISTGDVIVTGSGEAAGSGEVLEEVRSLATELLVWLDQRLNAPGVE